MRQNQVHAAFVTSLAMRKFENLGRIWVFVKDPNKKNIFRIAREFISLMVTKKELPLYYFKYLYKKGTSNYNDYMSRKDCLRVLYSKRLHNPKYLHLIENKLYFSIFHRYSSIPVPALLGYNYGAYFYTDLGMSVRQDKKGLFDYFEELFDQTTRESAFIRPLSAYGGKDCFKLSRNNLVAGIERYFALLQNGNFVYTEVIKQHPEIDKIHARSLNTMRMITLITSDHTIEVLSAFIRFGVGNSVVDNASSGGFGVGIHLEDGTLKEKGYFLIDFGGAEVYEHPDSGYRFGGFKVPFFKEACTLLKGAVQGLPDGFIGWDVAITPDGPVIIEANNGPHLPTVDIMYGGFLRNAHMKKLLSEL